MRLKRLTLITIAFLLCVLYSTYVRAQSIDDQWTEPVNLSHSGSTTDPSVVVDSNGITHVVWKDEFAGIVYSRFEDEQWSEPIVVNFPFADASTMRLVADANGVVHAFWLEEVVHAEELSLNYSRVNAEDMADARVWKTHTRLAQSALNFDMTVNDDGTIHLVYFRPLDTDDFPAGIYYRQSSDSGINWTGATILNQSQYYRSLIREEANLSLASLDTEESSRIFVTWDNFPRKRIFLSMSNDGGLSWEPAQEIDSPEISSGSASPFGIKVATSGENALLYWQSGDPEGICTYFYQSSSDAGLTWSERQQMLEDTYNCSQSSQFISGVDGITLLETTINDQVYLLAWDGSVWSDPQLQHSLSDFEDFETSDIIDFGCRQLAFSPIENQLVVVGCDASTTGDIWFTSRSIGNVTEWYPPPPVWTDPSEVDRGTGEIQSLELVSDVEGRMHAFWVQSDEGSQDGEASILRYAQWEGEQWTQSQPLFESISSNADKPSVTLDEQGRLLLTWSDLQTGELYFSWANSALALRNQEWVPPLTLPSPRLWARSPVIYISDSGIMYVTYIIPVNEDRGVYITHSFDRGESWSEPEQVFDAIAAGWDMVAQPSLSGVSGDQLHVMWARSTLPDSSGYLSLHSATSSDGGLNWSDVELVAENPVNWNQFIGSGGKIVHRLWQDYSFSRPVIRHQVSYDGGLSWESPTSISGFGEAQGEPGVAIDRANQLHLIQAFNEVGDKLTLSHWLWDGERWLAEENLELSQRNLLSIRELSTSVSDDGNLVVIAAASTLNEPEQQPGESLLYTSRHIQIPDVLPSPVPSPDESSVVTETVKTTATPVPEPTTAPVTPLPENPITSTGPPSLQSRWGGLILGGILAGLLIVISFGFALRAVLSTRKI